jgi:hypothetical protein
LFLALSLIQTGSPEIRQAHLSHITWHSYIWPDRRFRCGLAVWKWKDK